MSAADESNLISLDISPLINSLKEQVLTDRCNFIKDRIEENKKKLFAITNHIFSLSNSRQNATSNADNVKKDLLTQRKKTILSTLHGLEVPNVEKDGINGIEDNSSVSLSIILGNNFGGKNGFRPVKLEEVAKLPPYTTWIFLDRNQRMSEDQSVVGRRRIYYDQNCGEALICSDSEEEVGEEEEDKREFGNGENYILQTIFQEVKMSDQVLEYLAMYFDRKPCDIKARYENFFQTDKSVKYGVDGTGLRIGDPLKEKDLEAALDSFDNLFCRRCLVFDCRLHGCSQDLVFPVEKQSPWCNSVEGAACSNDCYRLVGSSENTCKVSSTNPPIGPPHSSNPPIGPPNSSSFGCVQLSPVKKTSIYTEKNPMLQQSESASSTAKVRSESSESEISPHHHMNSHNKSSPSNVKFPWKVGLYKGSVKRISDRVLVNTQKRRKRMVVSDSDSVSGHFQKDAKCRSHSHQPNKDANSSRKGISKTSLTGKMRKESPVNISHDPDCVNSTDVSLNEIGKGLIMGEADKSSQNEEFVDENICKYETVDNTSWQVLEKSLFTKGLEIFGRNSCLIARNLLNGMKTCNEVFQYMKCTENKLLCGNADGINSQANQPRRRSRFLRRRGRVRRLKYTWKSAGYHSIRKRISERKNLPCRQYNPCGCQSTCGKQCTCLINGHCCEKYCGCSKICKNRFRGCHCAKSQCRSRQCPCFAANRECDPDVCRNCWVGCGDGSLGGPVQRGDNYECRNMKLLLKQQQRVLLGRSDVSGWGAFLKNSVSKHEYLGEYTGELISHREADKRGKIYDRENSSFLFNLNDQFVLDAYRKGDKLKFANHSPDPNCYAKVIMVAGDHRVGIFAKERICAGEELFYDYRYEPDRAPAWARKPDASSSKKDEMVSSGGRAKKLA